MTRIKICGLTRQEDIAAVNQLLPDYIGFVFARSRRQIDAATAAALKKNLAPEIGAVGVFVNEDPKIITAYAEQKLIDLVQLHGDEDDGYIRRLRQHIPLPIIKAIRVKEAADIKKAQDLACDFLLFDAYAHDSYGGTGTAFNWSLLGDSNKPYFLAGGLSAQNVNMALSTCQPYCVDVSSGVETDGRKDPVKMEQLIRSVRHA